MLETLNSYTWEGPGGIQDLRFLVVQNSNTLDIIDTSIKPFSNGIIYTEEFDFGGETPVMSFTRVDGILVVATGVAEIILYQYDGSSVTKTDGRIKIRDLFGIGDIYQGEDITQGASISVRPETLSDEHLYNLRNQSWALPRFAGSAGSVDPIFRYRDVSGRYPETGPRSFPSNADNVNYALAKDATSGSYNLFYYNPVDLILNQLGSFAAPKGYFIIDALSRGESRMEQYAKLTSENPALQRTTVSLPLDKTVGGAKAVEEYAGRVFYAGFSSDVQGGDSKSPRYGSYIFYSALVKSPSDLFECYQEGDPTANDTPDLVDTDGGFIRISSAYNIVKMANVGSGLLVFAENGVWMITGGSDYGFTANNNLVTKVTERGTRYPSSVVVVDNTVMYWSEDGIYHVKQNQYGDWISSSLSEATIQSLYEGISEEDKAAASASYDSFDKKVRWVYQNRLDVEYESKELVLDLALGAFYPNTIPTLDGVYPKVCSIVNIPPNQLTSIQEDITYNGEDVFYNSELVTYSRRISSDGVRETAYLVAFGESYNVGGGKVVYPYGFCGYEDPDFTDWRDQDGVGTDAQAYLVTGYMSGGDFSRNKQVPYITFYLKRTEDGFEEIDGDWFPTNQSSCFVQSHWSWNNSAANGKWGSPQQVYRYRRLYSPDSVSDPFDNGEGVITTKSKLRGGGKVLSLKLYSEPKKNLVLYGWSMSLDVNANV